MDIRSIRKTDLEIWSRLRLELWPEHSLESLLEEARKIYENSNEDAFLAFYKGEISGFVECSIRTEAPECKTNNIGYVEGWYVKPECRKLGIGRKLLEKAEH